MTDFNVDDLYKAFYPYRGQITNLEIQNEEIPLYDRSPHPVAMARGRTRIKMTVEFGSTEAIELFSRDAKQMRELEYEDRLRQRYATLQKAYEEYQILLKLYK